MSVKSIFKKKVTVILASALVFMGMVFAGCNNGSDDDPEPPPTSGVEPVVVNNPVFTGWGGAGSQGDGNTFEMLTSQENGARITYTFPASVRSARASLFDTIVLSLAFERVGGGDLPMKIVIKDAAKDQWTGDRDIVYRETASNGNMDIELTFADFVNNTLTIAHNRHNNESGSFRLTITRITFSGSGSTPNPPPVSNELTVNNPVFTGWGGAGSQGDGSVFEMLTSQDNGARITYTLPSGASAYDTVRLVLTFERIGGGSLPMKIVIKDAAKDQWTGDRDIAYRESAANGNMELEFPRSEFANNTITIAHNRHNNESGSFRLTITRIVFFNSSTPNPPSPPPAADELVVQSPVFTGWGGAGSQGDNSTFQMLRSQGDGGARITYAFPAGASAYNAVRLVLAFERITANDGNDGFPMKIAVKDAMKDVWSGDRDLVFREAASNGNMEIEILRSDFVNNTVTIAHNRSDSSSFRLTITRIVFFNSSTLAPIPLPPPPADEIVVNNPVFTGWGGAGTQGNNSSFEMLNSQQWDAMITYAFPTEALVYNSVRLSFTLERIGGVNDALPMKLTIKDATVDNWGGPNREFPESMTDREVIVTRRLSDFTANALTMGHNRGAGTDSGDFRLTVTQIVFFNAP